MRFINNGKEAVKVKTEGDESLPPVFKTIQPGKTITANRKDYIKGYLSVGLIETKEKPKEKTEPVTPISIKEESTKKEK